MEKVIKNNKLTISIDTRSGFCPGVDHAIHIAEEAIEKFGSIYCLGQLVHNQLELERLEKLGLKVIDYMQFYTLKNTRVLVRAHGEKPEVFKFAADNNIELIDGTCRVVKNVQDKVKMIGEQLEPEDCIIIFGKKNHPEVIGLMGQVDFPVFVLQSEEAILELNIRNNVYVLSQTTMDVNAFNHFIKKLEIHMELNKAGELHVVRSICGQVSGRRKKLAEFASNHDVILFVAGKTSSNGLQLYELCRGVNSKTYFISATEDIKEEWFTNVSSVGIAGATSTPPWQLTETADKVFSITQ